MSLRGAISPLLLLTLGAGCGADPPAGSVQTRRQGGLLWQVDPPAGSVVREEAARYCGQLQLSGLDGWRLPTISELRGLIVGCPGRELGGACQVNDPGCTSRGCWTAPACGHCPPRKGPAAGGCYWAPGLWGGSCTDQWFTWSSSQFDAFVDHFWVVRFQGGGTFDDGVVGFNEELGAGSVRCVRTVQ